MSADTIIQYYEEQYTKARLSGVEGRIDQIDRNRKQEEKRLLAEMSAAKVYQRVRPETFLVIDWDEQKSIQITLLCPYLNARKSLQVIYNAGDQASLRSEVIEKAEKMLKEANERPYKFWC